MRTCTACNLYQPQNYTNLFKVLGHKRMVIDILIHAQSSFSLSHTHPHSEMLGGPSVLWASSVFLVPTGCLCVCPLASELGPNPGPGSGPAPELLVWGMVYTLEESADIQYVAPRARGLPEWCEPLARQQK